MPKSEKKKSAKIDPNLPFEKAMNNLESLVKRMESDQVALDELIDNFEMGSALYSICEARLDEAQGRIERIRRKRNGSVSLEKFDKAPDDESDLNEEDANTSGARNVTDQAHDDDDDDDDSDSDVEDGELF